MLADPLPDEVEILPSLDRLKERCTVAGGPDGGDDDERPVKPEEPAPVSVEPPLPGDDDFPGHLIGVLDRGFITQSEFEERVSVHNLVVENT